MSWPLAEGLWHVWPLHVQMFKWCMPVEANQHFFGKEQKVNNRQLCKFNKTHSKAFFLKQRCIPQLPFQINWRFQFDLEVYTNSNHFICNKHTIQLTGGKLFFFFFIIGGQVCQKKIFKKCKKLNRTYNVESCCAFTFNEMKNMCSTL